MNIPKSRPPLVHNLLSDIDSSSGTALDCVTGYIAGTQATISTTCPAGCNLTAATTTAAETCEKITPVTKFTPPAASNLATSGAADAYDESESSDADDLMVNPPQTSKHTMMTVVTRSSLPCQDRATMTNLGLQTPTQRITTRVHRTVQDFFGEGGDDDDAAEEQMGGDDEDM